MRVDAFTSSGTWTVPAGVTYAVAHIRAGGGGLGSSSGVGGNSSVAFAGGTVTAIGGNNVGNPGIAGVNTAGQANSGQGATGDIDIGIRGFARMASDGAYVVSGGAVTAGASITVTVGAGGAAGGAAGAAGGSGYVWIEYFV